MTLSTSLRTASRNLINTFGNTGSLYTYTSATSTENEEGDVSVSDWGTPASIKVVDGDNMKAELMQGVQGMETLGDDEKIVRDDVTVVVNDRLTVDGVDYRVQSVRAVRTQDTLVIQIITVTREDITSVW